MPLAILSRFRRAPLAAKLAIVAGLLAVLYLVFMWLVLPYAAEKALEAQLPGVLKRRVEVQDMDFNPFTNVLSVQGVRLREPGSNATFASVGRIVVDLESTSLVKLAGEVRTLRIERPSLRIVRRRDGTLNAADILAASNVTAEQGEATDEEGGVFPFILQNFVIEDGEVVLEDEATGKRFAVSHVNLQVPFTSSLPDHIDRDVRPRFTAVVNGDPLNFQGRVLPFADTLTTRFHLQVWGIHLAQYWDYVPLPGEGLSLESGRFSMNATLDFEQTGDIAPKVDLSGTFRADNLAVAGPDGEGRLGAVSVAARLAGVDLSERRVRVASVLVNAPYVVLNRRGDGSLELVELALGPGGSDEPPANRTEPDPGEDSPPLDLIVERAEISGGVVHLRDASVSPAFTERIAPLDVLVRNLRPASADPFGFVVDMAGEQGLRVRARGRAGLSPLRAAGNCSVSGVALPRLAPYYQQALPCRLASGELALALDYNATLDGAADVRVHGLRTSLRDLALVLPGRSRPFLELGELAVSGAELDLAGRKARVQRIGLDNPVVRVQRAANGTVDIASLAGSGGARPAARASEPAESNASGRPAWDVLVSEIALRTGRLEARDEAVSPAADWTLNMIRLSAWNATADPGKAVRARLSFALDEPSRVELAATVRPRPLQAEGRVKLARLPLAKAAAYLPPTAPVRLRAGRFDLAGTFRLSQGDKLDAAFDGGLGLDGLRLNTRANRPLFGLKRLRLSGLSLRGLPARVRAGSLKFAGLELQDPERGERVVGLEELGLSGIRTEQGPPLEAQADALAVAGLKMAVRVEQEGGLNLARIAQGLAPAGSAAPGAAAEAPANATPAPQPKIALERLRLDRGEVQFADATVAPAFETALHDITVRAARLDTDPDTLAELGVNATVDAQGGLFAEASLDPMLQSGASRVDVRIENVGLTTLSPYTVKHLAHPIAKGKLHGDVRAALEGREIEADNRLLIEDFEFGEEVESPEAMDLPLSLGLALLRDPSGDIHVDLPVSGSLDDPELSVAGMVLQAFANLIVKAATSPFTALAGLFGGEENSRVVFEAGSAELTPKASGGLDEVAEGLRKRPGLEVEVSGFAAPEADAEALSEAAFQQLLQRQKRKALQEEGESVPDGPPPILPGERLQYLETAYETADVPKETNFLGMVKFPAPEVMEGRLRNATRAGPSDLASLARERAEAVRDHLVQEAGIEAGRVFIRRRPVDEPPGEEGVPRRRVELELK